MWSSRYPYQTREVIIISESKLYIDWTFILSLILQMLKAHLSTPILLLLLREQPALYPSLGELFQIHASLHNQ